MTSHYPPPNDPVALGLIAHEALHLEQGLLVAPTAYGELQAWQWGFRVSTNLNGGINPYGALGDQILQIPLSHNPIILTKAVYLMEKYANGPDLIGRSYPGGWLLFFTISPTGGIYDLFK